MSLVKPGTYPAHPERLNAEKFAEVYESATSGNLVLHMAYRLDASGHVLQHWSALTQNGAPRERTIADLKERFGWDGCDPFWFETADLSGFPVEVVVEDEPGRSDPRQMFSKIKWVNTPGRGGGGGATKQVDRRALLAKYGAQFRAVAGPQPMKTAPKPPSAPKPPPKAPDSMPPGAERLSTLNDAWIALCTDNPASQDELAADWFAVQKEVCGEKTQDDFTPADWGRVLDRIEAMQKARAEG